MKIQRYSGIIILSLIALILVPLAMPVMADEPIKQGTAPALGMKVRVSPTTELTLLAVDDNKYTWNAKIQPQVTLDDGTSIDTAWRYDAKSNQWVAGANLFTASVSGETVTVNYNGESMTWTPRIISKETVLLFPNDKELAASYVVPLPVDPWNENYYGNTLQWQYANGITRNVRLIEGLIQEYYVIPAPLSNDVVFDVSPTKSKGYTYARELIAWDADGTTVELVHDGEYVVRLPKDTEAVYPITVDPDSSFTVLSADSGLYWTSGYSEDAGSSGEAWNNAHDPATAEFLSSTATTIRCGVYFSKNDYPVYYIAIIQRALVYFDTSGLSATSINVTDASLFLKPSTVDCELGNYSIVAQCNETAITNPATTACYGYTQYSDVLGYWNVTTLTTANQYYELPLTSAGVDKINTTGTTRFILRNLDHDVNDVSGFSSSGKGNRVYLYTYEQGTGYWPYLNVTYVAATAPIATTLSASNVANSTARLNGFINSSGGELCDVRFEYGIGTGNHTLTTAWVNDTYDTGATPYADVTDLASSTEYFYRVRATNSVGTVNGTEVSFTTESGVAAPTNLHATEYSDTISLAWTIGVGATNTLVRGKMGSYPTSIADGTSIYSGTGGTAIHEDLTYGATYYYSAWSESGGVYSTTAATVLSTVGITEAVTELPASPQIPTQWWIATDYSRLSSVPLYSEVNDAISGYGVAAETGWTFIFLAIVLLCTAAVFGPTGGNIFVTGISAAALLLTFSLLHLLPMWMMGISAVIFLSMATIRERI